MGTRSVTLFVEEDGTEVLGMYRQFDGYPEGHGKELADFIKDIYLVNGLGMGQPEKVANGIGCLALQVVTHFKKGPGGFYAFPTRSNPRGAWAEYVYVVSGSAGDYPRMKVIELLGDEDKVIFNGFASEFDA
jgi:hypothetical protein